MFGGSCVTSGHRRACICLDRKIRLGHTTNGAHAPGTQNPAASDPGLRAAAPSLTGMFGPDRHAAGYETISTALLFAILCLIQKPPALAKLLAEVDAFPWQDGQGEAAHHPSIHEGRKAEQNAAETMSAFTMINRGRGNQTPSLMAICFNTPQFALPSSQAKFKRLLVCSGVMPGFAEFCTACSPERVRSRKQYAIKANRACMREQAASIAAQAGNCMHDNNAHCMDGVLRMHAWFACDAWPGQPTHVCMYA